MTDDHWRGPILWMGSGAFRLCDEATDGQIIVGQRAAAAVESVAELEPMGELDLKGFGQPVPAFVVLGLKPPESKASATTEAA